MTANADRPLRIGLLSLAHVHAETYAGILRERDDVHLLSCDPGPYRDPEHARGSALARSLGVDYADSYDDVLRWQPDALIVTAENTRRPALLAQLATLGIPVLTEKPLTTTSVDLSAVHEIVLKHQLPLMLALPVRYASDFNRLKQDYRSGALGDIVSIQAVNTARLPAERSWFTDEELSGGGALMDHLVHVLDLVDHLTGDTALDVQAVANNILHPTAGPVETSALATIRYASDMIVSIDCSWSEPETAPTWGGLQLRIAGTRGVVDIDFFRPRLRGLSRLAGTPLELPYGNDLDRVMLDTFLRRVKGGEDFTTEADLASAARVVAVIEAAQESARVGATTGVTSRVPLDVAPSLREV